MNSEPQDLAAALRQWCELLESLRIALAEDRPSPGLSALGDGLADATDEVLGWLHEAEQTLKQPNSQRTVAQLVSRAIQRQGDTLFSAANQTQLDRTARLGGAPWNAWVRAVRSSAEPLWQSAAAAVAQLADPVPVGSDLSHTTYHATHFVHSDTSHPPVH
jgi:hypothetical protein